MKLNISELILSLLVLVPFAFAKLGDTCYYHGIRGECWAEYGNPSCSDNDGYLVSGQCEGSYIKCCIKRQYCSYPGLGSGECLPMSDCRGKNKVIVSNAGCPGKEEVKCCIDV